MNASNSPKSDAMHGVFADQGGTIAVDCGASNRESMRDEELASIDLRYVSRGFRLIQGESGMSFVALKD